MTNNSNGINWEDSVWQEINDAVVKEMAKVRIGQKVFPTVALDAKLTEVPNEVINFHDRSIPEGRTKACVRVFQEFALSSTQVSREPDSKTCQTLARMAAKAIALAEDTLIFQGGDGRLGDVQADESGSTRHHLFGHGLLGEANPQDADDDDPRKVTKPINVPRKTNGKSGVLYGENVFAAVADGIAKLTAKAQAPMYALFLPVPVYADTYVPPSDASLVTTAERIKPLVEGGFYGTGTLPSNRGLLVALAGDPTTLYVEEATTEFVRKEGSKCFFQVVERVQFVARDPRAFVLLNFE